MSSVKAAWPEPLNAKTAAVRARVSYSRARRNLSGLVRSGDLRRVGRGWYTLAKPPDADVDLRVENVVLVAARHNVIARQSDGVPGPTRLKRFQSRIDTVSRRSRMPGWAGAGFQETRTFYGPYHVYAREYDNGTITVQVGAKGGPSMSVFDFLGFCGWLAGHWEDVPEEGPGGWHVRSFELNHDFKDLRLDGAQSVSLHVFRNVLLKFYQKPAGLRVELRATHVDVSVAQLRDYAEDLARAYLRLGLVEVKEVER